MKNLILFSLLTIAVSAGAQTQNGRQTGCIGIGKCQQQGQQQGQTQSGVNTSTNTNGAIARSSEANSQVSNYEDTRQVAPAIVAPQFHTSPCVKGWGGAAQTGWAGLSIGAGKVDKGCDIRETAEQFRNAGSMTAFCKLMVQEPSAKKAGVTMADCMAVPAPLPPAAVQAVIQPTPQIIVPAPQVTVNVPAPVVSQVASPLPPVKHVHHAVKPCPTLEK